MFRYKAISRPLGTAVPAVVVSPKAADARPRFVFVGSLRRLKGVDVLLDVFEDLSTEGVPVGLELIGSVLEHDLGERARRAANVTLHPFMPQADLFIEVARHDCLILPSRFDSFGMVVAEAMAVGVPAIVSDRVGAKCIIEQHPDAGWVVPFGKDALKAKVSDLVANRAALDSARRRHDRLRSLFVGELSQPRGVDLEQIYARYGNRDAWLKSHTGCAW